MSQGSPLLSVGLAVRNGKDVVGRCIESVLSQDFTDLELVICDNVSDDGTIALLEEYARADPRIALHLNDVNIGSHENMKRTLELSRGRYFRWISADDWLEPGCLSACVAALESRPDAVGVTTWFTIHTDDGVDALRGVPRRVPDLARSGPALRAHAVVLPCRGREVRPGLRHAPARGARARPCASSRPSARTGC